ncbi:MAG: hypothetical protein ACRDPE_09345 [Solirubrobacterales bacterium]
MSLVVHVRHELVSFDLACAIALEAETEVGTTLGQKVRIGQLTKTQIREIAKDRVRRSGEPDYWPEVEDAQILVAARERVDYLWPKGA